MNGKLIRGTAVLLALCAFGLLTSLGCARPRADVLSYRHGLPAQLQQEVPNPGVALARLEAASTQPAGLTAAPDLPKGTQYLTVPLGEGPQHFVAAFDAQANGRRGALYFDTDCDGDLAEEEALKPTRSGSADTFGPIAVTLKREGATGLYHFYIRRWRQGSGDHWRLQPACYNVGAVTIGDKAYRMAVIDGTGNGLFNDFWSSSTGWPDHAYVDWNGDGEFGRKESLNCTRRYVRDGQWYKVSFSADGTEVSFTPTEFPMGTVTFGDFSLAAQFVSDTGQGGFIASGQERIEVPADDYSLLRMWVKRTDEAGLLWEASGSRSPGVEFTVREGQETTLAVGIPFTASLQAPSPGPYKAGQTIRFAGRATGTDGKNYQFMRAGERQPAPTMVIRDKAGKQISSYAFQYG